MEDLLALASQYSQEEIAVRSVESGMDILLHPRDARVTVNGVAAAVEQGRITFQRIQESEGRIRDAKTRLGLFERRDNGAAKPDYGQHRALARELSRKALSVVSGSNKALPFSAESSACFLLDDDAAGRGDTFLRALQARVGTFSGTVLTTDSDPGPEHVGIEGLAAEHYRYVRFSPV